MCSCEGLESESKMTKDLVWRLQEKPSGDVIGRLVEREIITKEEAKTILFREEDSTTTK